MLCLSELDGTWVLLSAYFCCQLKPMGRCCIFLASSTRFRASAGRSPVPGGKWI